LRESGEQCIGRTSSAAREKTAPHPLAENCAIALDPEGKPARRCWVTSENPREAALRRPQAGRAGSPDLQGLPWLAWSPVRESEPV
jgi:hypothetical protein